MTYTQTKDPLDEAVPIDQTHHLFIDPKAMLFILGTEIDYAVTPTRAEFVFNNPNEKGRCGCGESFHV